MYMYALSVLDATDVMALFATNVSFVYLLSWVVLHIQFVGLRVRTLNHLVIQLIKLKFNVS